MYCSNQPFAVLLFQSLQTNAFRKFVEVIILYFFKFIFLFFSFLSFFEINENNIIYLFQDCSRLPECAKINILGYLIKPVQRICRYPLLFKEIIKVTNSTHPDYNNLLASIEKLEAVVAIVNEVFSFSFSFFLSFIYLINS